MERGRNLRGLLFFISFWLLTPGFWLLTAGCSDKVGPGAVEVKRPVVTGVALTTITPATVDDFYETSGTVKAKTVSAVASRTMGTITAVRVREGDRVRAGQVLMTIDDRDMAQRVQAAERAVEAAQQQKALEDITYQRYRKLLDEKAVSRQEFDEVETRRTVAELGYERAKAQLREAQVGQGYARITAPTSGVVVEKKADAGSMAVPGVPLLVIEDTSSFTVEAQVDERLSGSLRAGMPVEVAIDATGQRLTGAVSEIVPAVNAQSRTFLVKSAIAGPALRTGLYAKVRIPVGAKEVIVVPQQAVVEKGQLTGVYTVDARGIVTYRLVRPGKKHGGMVEILSGIAPGERVITDGLERAVDGGIIQSTGQRVRSPEQR
ncbi:MAG: efflux RND transporter periplasmic adaptor subunit [Nitrospirota bacterium]